MDKEFIWEGNYGYRKNLRKLLKKILSEQDANSLQMLAIYVNNNPYNLELFIIASYKNPLENQIDEMIVLFNDAGLKQRKDLTMDKLMMEMGKRRFNSFTFIDEHDVDIIMDNMFDISEITYLEEEGYIMTPFGKDNQLFISHSSKDINDVEEIVPFLNAANLPIWFDRYSISVGDSIINSVQKGIEDSSAVIFWITKNFLSSNWCKIEMTAFIQRLIDERVLIINILDIDVDYKELPLFLRDIKSIKRGNEDIEDVARKVIPVIKEQMKISNISK